MGFQVLSYNIQRGIHLDGLLPLFEETPAFREADVVAIQEASFLNDGRNILESLAEVLSPNHIWTYKTVMSYPDKEYGNGFIFRDSCEIVDSYSIPLPQVANLKWYEKQKTEGGRPDTKSAFVQRFRIDGLDVQIANVHLDFCGGWEHRSQQLDCLISAIKARHTGSHGDSFGGIPTIICGDFNTVGYYKFPASRRNTRKTLDSALSRGFIEATPDLDYTSDLFGSVDPADPSAAFLNFGKKLGCRFLQKTDHILTRGFSDISGTGIISHPEPRLFEVSDHLPIHATVETGTLENSETGK